MIGALGSTCDPAVLISGSFAALRGDADELAARAGALEDAADDVAHRVVEAWIGESADAYAARRQTLTEGLRSVAQVYAIAVAVLRVHADRLEWGQSRAQVAIDLWDRGCAATTAAPRRIGAPAIGVRASQRTLGTPAVALTTRPPVADPAAGAATKARAQQILTCARSEVSASAHAAQVALDELSAGLPDGRWHTDQFVGGLGDWVAGIAGLVATFNSFRAFADPVGYYDDARELGAAVYAIPGQFAEDPVGITETLLDAQTLRDNPGRWWGRMAPDIAISLATAGVGLAANSGRLGVLAAGTTDRAATVAGWTAGARVGALTEQQIGSALERILQGTSALRQPRSTMQLARAGGFNQANLDFNGLVRGVEVIDRGLRVRTATLSNGTKINVRPTSSGGPPTLEIVTPGSPAIKIRY